MNTTNTDLFGDLNDAEKKHFMEVCYQKILANPQLLLDNKISTAEIKLNSVNILIKYFENKEEYEKCADLKKLIKKLENGRKNNCTSEK